MDIPQLLSTRLHNQGLSHTSFKTPHDVVSWLGAVQAQEYPGALWSLRQRLPNGTIEDIEKSFNEGSIIRTHIMRPTWHFVSPKDIRWMLMLTSPRVNKLMEYYNRQLELTDAIFKKSASVVEKALEGKKYLTRTELGVKLHEAGVEGDGRKIGHIIIKLELDALICSGPKIGKQFSYALLEERVPKTKVLSRDEALAELTKRYFTSHGPALIKDFSWWSGLTMADGKNGIEMNKKHLEEVIMDGKIYYFNPSLPFQKPSQSTYLLSTYDEYTIAYNDRSTLSNDSPNKQMIYTDGFYSSIIMDGYIVGAWRRTVQKGHIAIQTRPFDPFSQEELKNLERAGKDFGEFLKMPLTFK